MPAGLAAGGCGGTFRNGVYRSSLTEYRLDAPGEAWRQVASRGANLAFRHDGLGALLYTDDSCRAFEDAPLKVLANHLFFGFTEVQVLEDRPLQLDGRDAWRRVARARLDGVPVQVAATVVKKNDCVYDVVYVAPPSSFATSLDTYEGVVRSFRVLR